jgi:4-amino-4-deoxy-L-arabinose transferase-like glycosyltransferase
MQRVPRALRRPRDRFWVGLLLIALVGLVVRVVYILWMHDVELTGDGYHYHLASQFIADGRGFINPLNMTWFGDKVQDAVHPPAWTLLLTGLSSLGVRSVLAHQLFAALVGTATVVMTGLAGREAFGRRPGLLAAALAAVYANIWLYEREVLAEPLAMLGIATIIYLAYRFLAGPSLVGAVLLGGAVGVLTLTRAEMFVLGLVLVTPLILGRTALPWSRRIGWLALAGATCVALIAPWTIFNATRFERPVPLSTGLGTALGSGNCNATYHGKMLGYAEWGCILLLPEAADEPSVADQAFRGVAIDYIKDHLSEQPRVVSARLGRTFGLFRPSQQLRFEGERGSDLWVLQLGALTYYLLLPFAIAGVVIARRRRVKVYPLLAVPLVVVLAVSFTIGAIRYRAPAEVCLVLLAAVALDQLYLRWRRGRREEPAGERLVLGESQAASDTSEPRQVGEDAREPERVTTGRPP